MRLTDADRQHMLALHVADRREDALQLLRVRRRARQLSLRLRRCCPHCMEYRLVARVGNRVVLVGMTTLWSRRSRSDSRASDSPAPNASAGRGWRQASEVARR
jgi:hypothetical protein